MRAWGLYLTVSATFLVWKEWGNCSKFGIYYKIIAGLGFLIGLGFLYLDGLKHEEKEEGHEK